LQTEACAANHSSSDRGKPKRTADCSGQGGQETAFPLLRKFFFQHVQYDSPGEESEQQADRQIRQARHPGKRPAAHDGCSNDPAPERVIPALVVPPQANVVIQPVMPVFPQGGVVLVLRNALAAHCLVRNSPSDASSVGSLLTRACTRADRAFCPGSQRS